MERPISKGDLCRVIDGVYKHKSPNVGKLVTVESIQGNHSTLGVIWRCSGQSLQAYDADHPSSTADFPAAWLKRIEPPKTPDKVLMKEVEHE